jgi:HAD superfamily hydrolase (TIGR01490 family)
VNLAIFDFCDTLVNFQTADEFCRFVLKKESKKLWIHLDSFLTRWKIYNVLLKSSFFRFPQKRLLLWSVRGIRMQKINGYGKLYVDEILMQNMNEEVLLRFKGHLSVGDTVVINSGGYEPYLRHFSNKFGVDMLFSTEFESRNDIFLGYLKGRDCLGSEKVKRIRMTELLNNSYNDIYVYSDSITDTPLFDLATKKVAVIQGNEIPKWCDSNFEKIFINEELG